MSIQPWFDVWCDGERGDGFACGNWISGGASKADAAVQARRFGWDTLEGKWLCPQCLDEKTSS